MHAETEAVDEDEAEQGWKLLKYLREHKMMRAESAAE
jgi:hypothetical protein